MADTTPTAVTPRNLHAILCCLAAVVCASALESQEPKRIEATPDRIEADDAKVRPADHSRAPSEVRDPLMIVFDVLLAGLPDPALHDAGGNLPVNRVKKGNSHVTDTYWLAKRAWEHDNGKGWTVRPEKFYLGGLRFAQGNRKSLDGYQLKGDPYFSELGMWNTPPRNGEYGDIHVPLHDVKNHRFVVEKIGKHPTAHFILTDAHWVYKASKEGEKDRYFAVAHDERARTMHHCAYAEDYARAIKALEKRYPGAIFGRSYEGVNLEVVTLIARDDVWKFRPELSSLRGYLKFGNAGSSESMKKDYPGIKVFAPGF